ncbi:chorismate mutase [Clostridia bacterium OttesenSCG-928-O13]|nr:chorismate mutase [Clostridia bacterium OttesenSCG-928-O13]
MNLDELRTQLDAVDSQLLPLFLQRMDIVRNVALYKKEEGLPIYQPQREAGILAKVRKAAGPENADAAQAFFAALMAISKDEQQKLLDS